MSLSQKPKQQLAALEAAVPALEMALKTAAYAHDVEGANINDVLAAEANLSNHCKQMERLRTWTIPEAERRDREAEEAARSVEEQRQAAIEQRARQASFKGAQISLANWRRHAATIPAACDALAVALKNMEASVADLSARLPDDAPYDPAWGQFGDGLTRRLIADELARAGAAHDVTLPGANRSDR